VGAPGRGAPDHFRIGFAEIAAREVCDPVFERHAEGEAREIRLSIDLAPGHHYLSFLILGPHLAHGRPLPAGMAPPPTVELKLTIALNL